MIKTVFNQPKGKKIILSALFLSLGMVLPFLTGQIKELGDTLLPMHIPVMLCGVICGAKYGLVVGFLLPFLRAISFGMPPLFPNAVWMATELATYGFVTGLLYAGFQKKTILHLYCSLLISMISGRAIWGITKVILLGAAGKTFTISAFIMGGFIDSFPGIILQLILIPVVVKVYYIYSGRGVGGCETVIADVQPKKRRNLL